MNQSDTICALATAPGVGGIAVIRVSGSRAFECVDQLFHSSTKISQAPTHTIQYGRFRVSEQMQDEVTIAVFRSPRSYTGEDVAEISCHGGLVVPQLIISSLLQTGVRHAEAGEFTKRAFINGKMDLTQVESVAELIHSSSAASATVAAKQLHGAFRDKIRSMRQQLIDLSGLLELELDFANEDLELIPRQRISTDIDAAIHLCRAYLESFSASTILRSGFRISLIGHPNAGKSMLFNELVQFERSIVHDQAGTTRDYIQESVLWDGMRVIISDTAGLRQTENVVEAIGVNLSNAQASDADLILVVNDSSISASHSDEIISNLKSQFELKNIEIIQNKADLAQSADNNSASFYQDLKQHHISAKTGQGMSDLRAHLRQIIQQAVDPSKEALLNQRHLDLLHQALNSLLKAQISFNNSDFSEIVAFELRQAVEALGLIIGEIVNEEVLLSVFSKFCIGK